MLRRLRRPAAGRVVELALPGSVDEALPLVPVEYEDPPGVVAGHPHQHPVAAGPAVTGRGGDITGAVVITRAPPGKRRHVNAEFFRSGLPRGLRRAPPIRVLRRD